MTPNLKKKISLSLWNKIKSNKAMDSPYCMQIKVKILVERLIKFIVCIVCYTYKPTYRDECW